MEKSLCGLEEGVHVIPCLACANLAVELTLAAAAGQVDRQLTQEQASPRIIGSETAARVNRIRNHGAGVLNAI
jgi:hypothetical protein